MNFEEYFYFLYYCGCVDMQTTACVWGQENNLMEFFLSFHCWGVPRIQLRSSASRQMFYMLNHPAGPGILYVHDVCKSAPAILKQVLSSPFLSFLVSTLTSSYFWPFYSFAHFMISIDTPLLVIHWFIKQMAADLLWICQLRSAFQSLPVVAHAF